MTCYGLDGPGIESRWVVEIFRTCPDRPWGPPSLLYNGYRVFSGSKERPEGDADPSPPSSVVIMKRWSYTSTPPMGRSACTEPQYLYKSVLYFYLSYCLIYPISQHNQLRSQQCVFLRTCSGQPLGYHCACMVVSCYIKLGQT